MLSDYQPSAKLIAIFKHVTYIFVDIIDNRHHITDTNIKNYLNPIKQFFIDIYNYYCLYANDEDFDATHDKSEHFINKINYTEMMCQEYINKLVFKFKNKVIRPSKNESFSLFVNKNNSVSIIDDTVNNNKLIDNYNFINPFYFGPPVKIPLSNQNLELREIGRIRQFNCLKLKAIRNINFHVIDNIYENYIPKYKYVFLYKFEENAIFKALTERILKNYTYSDIIITKEIITDNNISIFYYWVYIKFKHRKLYGISELSDYEYIDDYLGRNQKRKFIKEKGEIVYPIPSE